MPSFKEPYGQCRIILWAACRVSGRRRGSVENVQDCGATGNGTTDDTQAIQNVIDAAAKSPNGGQIYFPEGTYRISSPISVTSPGIELVGEGRYCSMLQCYSPDNHAVVFLGQGTPPVNLAECSIRHLGIQQMCPNTNMNATLLFIKYVFQFRAENLLLLGAVGANIYAQQLICAQGTSVYLSQIDAFGAGTSGIKCFAEIIGDTLYGNDYFLSDLTVQMNGKAGRPLNLIDVTGGAVQAVNSNFLAGEQCYISNTAFATFTNCYFDSAQQPVCIDAKSEHVYFSNCEFANRPGGGALVNDAKSVVFSNSMVINNGGNGIELSGQSSDVVISSCVIDGNNTGVISGQLANGSGIYLQDGAANAQIVGNRIGNISSKFGGNQKYAVYLEGNNANVMVNSNNLTGNHLGSINSPPTVELGNLP